MKELRECRSTSLMRCVVGSIFFPCSTYKYLDDFSVHALVSSRVSDMKILNIRG